MRILFTGGSGKAGRHATAYLRDQGHRVTNLDWVASDVPGITTLKTDLTDAGQVFNACQAYAGFDELEPGTGVPRYDAIVHFAAIPAILHRPDNETYRINTLSTYNILDAATKLGIPKVIFASSETTYGVCFADGEQKPDYLPVDEEHPTVPQDSYAMSKVVNEVTARSSRRARASISTACASTTLSSPTNTARISQPTWATLPCAAAISSPTSTPATWARWSIAA